MITVEPLTDAERVRCACCGKRMLPRDCGNTKDFRTEEDLAAFTTNRRVIAIRRVWYPKRNSQGDYINEKKLYKIVVKFFPLKHGEFGYDGIFCTSICAMSFGRLAYAAGFRKSRKAA